jgi:uncharacterized protein
MGERLPITRSDDHGAALAPQRPMSSRPELAAPTVRDDVRVTTTSDPTSRRPRPAGPPAGRRILVPLIGVPLLLFGVPWWVLVLGGQAWPGWVVAVATVVFVAGFVALPWCLAWGHGPRHLDGAARVGDTLLGVAWVLFTWSVVGGVVELVVGSARVVAAGVVGVVVVLVAYGVVEARRVPRVREREVRLARLGPGLDGLRVVMLADTHFGPIDRSRWSRRVAEVVAGLRPDLLVHAGDLADGDVPDRVDQVRPLADLIAPLGRFSIVGNHEHFSGARQWVEHMHEIGWQPLVNAHQVVERDGDRLVVAGVDDPTGAGSDLGGPDLAAALAGTDPDLPVLLLAHQPKQVVDAVAAGVDLQVSGHTHGGQIWPFHLLVRLDQPVLAGLSQHGERTQLYTSRGTGFWGPPLRVFAPSEITELVLRAG